MARYIDADAYLKKVCTYSETGCGSCPLQTTCPADEHTIDAIPVEWILNNERMPKAGTGRKVIMDMLEDWRKEHDQTD